MDRHKQASDILIRMDGLAKKIATEQDDMKIQALINEVTVLRNQWKALRREIKPSEGFFSTSTAITDELPEYGPYTVEHIPLIYKKLDKLRDTVYDDICKRQELEGVLRTFTQNKCDIKTQPQSTSHQPTPKRKHKLVDSILGNPRCDAEITRLIVLYLTSREGEILDYFFRLNQSFLPYSNSSDFVQTKHHVADPPKIPRPTVDVFDFLDTAKSINPNAGRLIQPDPDWNDTKDDSWKYQPPSPEHKTKPSWKRICLEDHEFID